MFVTVDIFFSAYIFFALSCKNDIIIVLLIVWIVIVYAAHFTKIEHLLGHHDSLW